MTAKTAAARRRAGADTCFDVLDGGKLRIYDGTQPTDADTALGSQNVLAELALNADSFANATGGPTISKVANAISDDTSADMTGTASWGSLLTSGNTRIMDFSVGTSGTDMIINTTAIVAGARVSCSSFTIQQGP